MKEKRCECCESDYESEYYKYDNKLYCFDCLVEQLEELRNWYDVPTENF